MSFFSFHATLIALKVKHCVNYYIHNFSNSSTRRLCFVVQFNVISFNSMKSIMNGSFNADKASQRCQIWPSEHAMKEMIDLQQSCWTDMQIDAISELFYRPINSLNRAAGTVCSPVFLLDKSHSVKPAETSSLLSRSVSAGKLDETMQNNAVWCYAKVTH